jgi:hypothetical protein
MEKQQKTFNKIKVHQLNIKDRKLAYANHVIEFKNRNVKPDTIQKFLNENVIACFSFDNSNEGHKYWFAQLDEIVKKENRKQLYLKESKFIQTKQIVPLLIISFICFISFILAFVYLLFILFNL